MPEISPLREKIKTYRPLFRTYRLVFCSLEFHSFYVEVRYKIFSSGLSKKRLRCCTWTLRGSNEPLTQDQLYGANQVISENYKK